MRYYLSHSIRGKAGAGASHDIQATNCKDAICVANILRKLFPKLVLYVPAENETFVQICCDSGHLSEKEILDVDCKIIDGCDGVLVYVPKGDGLQGGRLVEHDHAIATDKPCVVFSKASEAADFIQAMYGREQL